MGVHRLDLALPGRERELGVIEELLGRVGDRGGSPVVCGEVGQASAAIIKGSMPKVYSGAPHGSTDTHKQQLLSAHEEERS